jgi:signal transduction histidine kinase
VRWALVRVALATTTMVALAFLVPLWMVVSQIARDRALVDARQQASAMVAALTVTTDRTALAEAEASTDAGGTGRLALHLPDGPAIGTGHAAPADVARVAQTKRSGIRNVSGGVAYLQAVALRDARIAVIEVFVPDTDLRRGVPAAWLAMTGVGLVLVGGSALVADRLGARIVGSVRDLAAATRSFGQDDLAARIEPSGPPELVGVGRSFNAMADRMVGLLRAERELAANLSHRLRTPVTALRLELEGRAGPPDLDRLRQTVMIMSDEVDGIIRAAQAPLSARSSDRCDLTDVLADRLAFWAVLAEDHGRPWTVLGDSGPLWVPAVRADAENAIDALLGNVFHHTPEGTPFRAGIVGQSLVVEDDGPGIADPQAAARRGASSSGSTGLGLDIVRQLAVTAGGTVHIGPGKRGGTRVEVAFKSTSEQP